jgi:hypothetical protein
MTILACAVLAAPAGAGELGKLVLAREPTEVLGGRLRVNLPASARLESRQPATAPASESAEEESRIVLDAGKEELVVIVHDLFARAGDNFAASVRQEISASQGALASEYSLHPLRVADPACTAIAVAPREARVQGAVAFLQGAYVALPDGTVLLIHGYVNPEGLEDRAGADALLAGILASASAGPRKLLREAGVRTLEAGLTVTVPADVIFAREAGSTFRVHWLKPMRLLGGPSEGGIGMYLGRQPDRTRHGVGLPDINGTLLGQDVQWHAWRTDDKTAYGADVILRMESEFLHVFMWTADEGRLTAFRAIAESLRGGSAPGH